jgi:hypothetical protein
LLPSTFLTFRLHSGTCGTLARGSQGRTSCTELHTGLNPLPIPTSPRTYYGALVKKPVLSAHARLHGTFDYNRIPQASPGTCALLPLMAPGLPMQPTVGTNITAAMYHRRRPKIDSSPSLRPIFECASMQSISARALAGLTSFQRVRFVSLPRVRAPRHIAILAVQPSSPTVSAVPYPLPTLAAPSPALPVAPPDPPQ